MGNLASIGYGVGKYLTDADQDAVGADLSTINNGLLQFAIADSKDYAHYPIVNGSVDAYVDETNYDGWSECWPVLVVDMPNHVIDKSTGKQITAEIMISQDEECNGPGVILGLHDIKELTNA